MRDATTFETSTLRIVMEGIASQLYIITVRRLLVMKIFIHVVITAPKILLYT